MENSFFKINNSLWFKESLYNNCGQVFSVSEKICNLKTKYQNIDIFSNKTFGKILVLDGIVQLTEFDEYIYHEAMAHAPLFLTKGDNKRVCIVGGGDGGVLREVVKHKCVSEITIIEIDKQVVDTCVKYLPNISDGAYDDERVQVIHEDAVAYLKNIDKGLYDVVIIDSTDPNEFARDLYTTDFYSAVSYSLKDDGVAIFQSGSILMQPDEYIDGYGKLGKIFKNVSLLKVANATYYGGEFCLLLVHNSDIVQQDVQIEYNSANIQTKWYSPQKYFAALVNSPSIKNKIK